MACISNIRSSYSCWRSIGRIRIRRLTTNQKIVDSNPIVITFQKSSLIRFAMTFRSFPGQPPRFAVPANHSCDGRVVKAFDQMGSSRSAALTFLQFWFYWSIQNWVYRESNPGLPRSRGEFYHWTNNAYEGIIEFIILNCYLALVSVNIIQYYLSCFTSNWSFLEKENYIVTFFVKYKSILLWLTYNSYL